MKKLFTLALILLVATTGYAQVRKVSKNDAKNKVATMQMTKGMENLENVQTEPNTTRWDYGEGELDYTIYDWQTNWGNINRTIVWPDGKVSFAYTMSNIDNFVDIGTGIGTYDSNNDEWIPSEGRVEIEKTYFGSIARYRDNSIVVAANTTSSVGVFIVEDKDNMMPGSAPTVSHLSPAYDLTCPVVMTSGADRDIIHIIATGSIDNKLYYFRSTDGGYTWDKENEILPFLTEEYGIYWGSHVAYWMETTEDNRLALVVNNPWSDGMVIYSYDNGETWERKMFYQHPGINTTFGDWFMYPRWASCVWGVDNELCVAYEFNCNTGEPGSGNYDLGVGGVAFWSESLPHQGSGQPFIMDSTYIGELWASSPYFNDPPYQMWPEYIGYITPIEGTFNIHDLTLHGDYKCGPVAMPVLVKLPITDGAMLAVWCSLDLNNTDGTSGKFYFKLWASISLNGGHTWTPQFRLISDFMWELNEFIYPQVAVVGTTLVVVVQTDSETGTFVQGDDPYGGDTYYQGFTFDLFDLPIPPVPIPGNPEWYYEIEWDDGSVTYQHLECTGDTVMQGQRPKVIVRSNTHYDRDTITEVTHEYIYEENGFVYWWNKDLEEFTILYDLTANVGDEWEIMVGTESLTMHVDAVRYIEYEGRTYRTLTVSDPENFFSGDIVCGIGHLTSFFPERLMNRDKSYSVEGLRCYWVEGELVFKIGDADCDAIYSELQGLDETTDNAVFAVYPNPTNNVLFVETRLTTSNISYFIASQPTAYRITNLTGQTLLQGHITAETQQIDVESLPAGMYFISMGGQTVKFVVK